MSPEQNPPDGPITLDTAQLLAWSAALAFFGVFLAVPLRSQTIIREKLRCGSWSHDRLTFWRDTWLGACATI